MPFVFISLVVLVFCIQQQFINVDCQGTEKHSLKICNSAGSLSEFLNPENKKCLCKENVEGDYCDSCKDGSFNLQKYHIAGCVKCLCSKVTEDCEFKEFSLNKIIDPLNYTLQLYIETQETVEITKNGIKITKDSNSSQYNFVENNEVYWILSHDFNGDKITSYGGNISFSITLITSSNTSEYSGVRLVIISSKGNLTWSNIALKPNINQTIQLPLREDVLAREYLFHPNTREHIMNVLTSVESVQLRATQTPWPAQVVFENIRMDVMNNSNFTNPDAETVKFEMCKCPEGYAGTSCEICDTGYYKKTHSNGTSCSKCPCNGREIKCIADGVNSVTCVCKQGFRGSNCEIVTPDPVILEPFPDVSEGIRGSSIVLNCITAVPLETTVSWYFEINSNEQIEKKHCFSSSNPVCSLKVSNLDQKDEGAYICKAYNSQGSVEKKTILKLNSTQKNQTLRYISQQCLKIATIILMFLCIIVLIPITLLCVLNRCNRKTNTSSRSTEILEL